MPDHFTRLTAWASDWSGSPAALLVCTALTAAWLAAGFLTGWSAAWSGVGGAVTGVVSIFMLILLRGAQLELEKQQAEDTASIKMQLAELVRAVPEADDSLISPDVAQRLP